MRGSVVGRTLAACVAARCTPSATDLERCGDELAERAVIHRVPGVVYRRFVQLGLDPPAQLGAAVRETGIRWMAMVEDLRLLRETFDSIGVEHLVFKGPALTVLTELDEIGRPAIDLDVLVRPVDLERARSSLLDLGAVSLDRNWPYVLAQRLGEVHLVLPHGTSLDLHWNLLVSERLRSLYRPRHGALFGRARTLSADSVPFSTLSASDTFVYTCMHACITGGHLLVHAKDVEGLLTCDPPDWDEVVRTASAWGCHLQVAAMLLRTERTLGTSVDHSVVERLAPSAAFRAVTAMVDRVSPMAETTRNETFLRLATRSIAPSVPRSIVRFGERSTAYVRQHLPRHEEPHLNVLLEDVADPTAERAYFDWVGSSAVAQNWA